MTRTKTDEAIKIPLTKMNFLVTVEPAGMAAFTEISGIEASVDVVEFRQGISNSLSPIKIPGLVKHGNVTLKFGCSIDNEFIKWINTCVSFTRKADIRNVKIELIDIMAAAPDALPTAGQCIWTLKNAWVIKYSGVDLNSMSSEVAIESVELAYEE